MTKRTNYYASIIYPDNPLSNDFISKIEATHVPCLISPLHDLDINPGTGEVKKPHYHVVLLFDSLKTEKQAKEIFNHFTDVAITPVNSIRGYVRYLCHLDNPDKAQYNEDNIIQLNGADYFGYNAIQTDKYKAIGEMIDYIEENDVHSYRSFLMYTKNYNESWFRSLCDNSTMVIKEYLKSRTWDIQKNPFTQSQDNTI